MLAGLALILVAGGLIFLLLSRMTALPHIHPPFPPSHAGIPQTGPLVSGTVIIDPFARLVEAAQRGDVHAQARLGEAHRYGLAPMTHDPRLALEWLNRAGQRGHPDALRHLGEMALAGEGTVPNGALGVDLLFRAARAGSAEAARTLHAMGY